MNTKSLRTLLTLSSSAFILATALSGCGGSSEPGDSSNPDDSNTSSNDNNNTNNPPSSGTTNPPPSSTNPPPSGTGDPPPAGTSDPPPAGTSDPPPAPGSTPVGQHGTLKVSGGHVIDKNGQPVQLKGMSLFWSQWAGDSYNASLVKTVARDWHGSLIRAAMGIENGGYLKDPAAEKARVKTIVEAAIAEGIYVIIDWHDHNANQHTQQSKEFFTEMAKTYGNKENVLFEVFNEPDMESWSQVKAYAEEVIGAIRGAGANNVVIVGSPNWSQDVDVASKDPVKAENVAYTLHFYANTHRQALRDKASVAIKAGLTLFSTEWGTCDASGAGSIDLTETQKWLDFYNTNKISWANWSLFNKEEACSALVPSAGLNGGWSDADLTPSGKFVKQKMGE